ncbi:phenylalanine--tRNA ligase subunit beta [Candidatus Gottesmanbacteria bacterium]|nr:phenylalanine--tRNA ligase subunit beta [Candidatus Gottesmanbacteria bacterium]
MNILIPDHWLREYLETKATPQQIKEYLSLCGPSVERMHEEDGEVIYDIEVTGNRPDSMSIVGVAREAAAILPRFGIAAKLLNDPYFAKVKSQKSKVKSEKKLSIKTDGNLNPRWTSVVLDNVTVGPPPAWLKKRLEATGIRPFNTVIDVTNYIMRAYGQPVHAFDYDQILPKNGVPTMILRASQKGERIITLDGKTHSLTGDDIVIEDGSGRLIDLCGIMGAQNSSVKSTTKTIVLFMQTYDPSHIRKTSMSIAHRTEAAGLFEKGLDPELVMPSIHTGIELINQVAGGDIASKIYDIYPKPYKPYSVTVSRPKVDAYIGKHLTDKEILDIMTTLGFKCEIVIPGLTRNPSSFKTGSRPASSERTRGELGGRDDMIRVTVPSFRRDVIIDVDIIEELSRIYGYQNITSTLPDTAPPVVMQDPTLTWEEEIKVRLRDWGYTETYTYSMISEELMDAFHLDKSKTYKISNPLSNEWMYMRPSLLPSMLAVMKQNLSLNDNLKLFELSMIYSYRPGELPNESTMLVVALSGDRFVEAKGLTESLFELMGIPFVDQTIPSAGLFQLNRSLYCGKYGVIGLVDQSLLTTLQINKPVTIVYLNLQEMITNANSQKTYIPIPKYPASFEDLAFVLPPKTAVGPIITALKYAHPLVTDVSLLDQYETTTTFHITYLSPEKNLTTEDLRPIREKLIALAQQKFNAELKTM